MGAAAVTLLTAFAVLTGCPVTGRADRLPQTEQKHSATQTEHDATPTPRVVVEMFTSQGCSSCPPADRLMAQLSNDPGVIVLTLAVDYWDYLGWKDTLALHDNTVRQRAYAGMRGDREIFTPQAVVDGVTSVVGSDSGALNAAVADTATTASALKVPVSIRRDGGDLVVSVAAGDKTAGEIWLCPVSDKVAVSINRGENNGRTITYANVVRRWIRLGVLTGQPQTFTVPLDSLAYTDLQPAMIDRAAVLVQSGAADNPGPIIGAALGDIR